MTALSNSLSSQAPLKLVVSGPVGAGKTTFVQTLSQTPVVATEAEASEDIGKTNTTVAFDFGTLHLGGHDLHLYGTPGQDRFSFMWEVLCEGALGLVLLVAGDRPQDFAHARSILDFITSRIPVPFLVGVTRQDQDRVWDPADVALYFGLPQEQVVGLNATDPAQARDVLALLLESTLSSQPTFG
ncbi:ATP/GTP-binding protein [Deinococcus sp. NW-56]|uniref:GTP-binding protein n=1 Tax=Deinococcus sp. NW-56 TaxID=2080419 RepID=UPI000CF3F738|nr:ATP/GTP-binding protein [Deinococcus sp. NW-56]